MNDRNKYNHHGEYLFWLVFHNKYLLNIIINYIQTIEWVIYDDHKQLHVDNRIKFKDIHSLDWMIKNEQYNLLHNKLDNNDNIEINTISINTLFNKKDINKNDHLFIKILNKKRNEINNNIDLTFEAVKCNNVQILKLLINEPYSYKINPSTLEYAIINSHPSIVKEILSKINIIIYKELFINNNILELAIKNTIYQAEMIEFVLSINTSTLEIKEFNSLSTKQLLSLSIIKLKEISNELYIKYYRIYICKYKETIDECHDFNNNNIETKIIDNCLVYNENLFKYLQFLNAFEIFNNKTIIIDKISIIQDCINQSLVWNQLLFDMLIFNRENQIEGGRIEKIIINNRSTIDWILNCNNKSILSFIRGIFKVITFETLEMADYVFKESGLLNHILNNNNNNNFIKLNKIGGLKYINQLKFTENSFNGNGFLNFLSENINGLFILDNSIYTHVWYQAIKECDFKTIKYIESLNTGIYNLTLSLPWLIQQQLSNEKIIKWINYLNETDGGFDEQSFKYFFDTIKVNNEIISNVQINFRIECNLKSVLSILTQSMINMNINMVELLLNSNIFNQDYGNIDKLRFYNHFRQTTPSYLFYKEEGLDFIGKVIHYKEKEGATRFEIIEIIKKLITKTKIIKPKTTTTTINTNINPMEPISVIINFFFKKLIQIKGISMDQVKQVYQIVVENSIKVTHDIFHSFYYLNIKDIKYTKYILCPIYIEQLFKNRTLNHYNCLYVPGDGFTHLQHFIKPIDFTFEIINTLQFDKVLEMLVLRLSSLIIEKNQSFKNENNRNLQLNEELEFYLIIRRIDLFLNKLHFIKTTNIDNCKFKFSEEVIKSIDKVLEKEIINVIDKDYHDFKNN